MHLFCLSRDQKNLSILQQIISSGGENGSCYKKQLSILQQIILKGSSKRPRFSRDAFNSIVDHPYRSQAPPRQSQYPSFNSIVDHLAEYLQCYSVDCCSLSILQQIIEHNLLTSLRRRRLNFQFYSRSSEIIVWSPTIAVDIIFQFYSRSSCYECVGQTRIANHAFNSIVDHQPLCPAELRSLAMKLSILQQIIPRGRPRPRGFF